MTAGEPDTDPLPIKMLHDRVLVDAEEDSGERRSGGGIVIPATVKMGRRLAWAKIEPFDEGTLRPGGPRRGRDAWPGLRPDARTRHPRRGQRTTLRRQYRPLPLTADHWAPVKG